MTVHVGAPVAAPFQITSTANVNACAGQENVRFTSPFANGNQWFVKPAGTSAEFALKDGKVGDSQVTGTKAQVLSLLHPGVNDNGTYFARHDAPTCGASTSNGIKVTMKPSTPKPVIKGPAMAGACPGPGAPGRISLTASSAHPENLRWYARQLLLGFVYDGSSWKPNWFKPPGPIYSGGNEVAVGPGTYYVEDTTSNDRICASAESADFTVAVDSSKCR